MGRANFTTYTNYDVEFSDGIFDSGMCDFETPYKLYGYHIGEIGPPTFVSDGESGLIAYSPQGGLWKCYTGEVGGASIIDVGGMFVLSPQYLTCS